MVDFTGIAQASLEKVWNNLLLKIEHPENYVPGVSNVFIVEKKDNFVIRKMDVPYQESTITLLEKITFEPYKVRFELIEHPHFTGYVDNDAISISETETKIKFSINWINKTTHEPITNPEMVKNAVLKTIHFIESQL